MVRLNRELQFSPKSIFALAAKGFSPGSTNQKFPFAFILKMPMDSTHGCSSAATAIPIVRIAQLNLNDIS